MAIRGAKMARAETPFLEERDGFFVFSLDNGEAFDFVKSGGLKGIV